MAEALEAVGGGQQEVLVGLGEAATVLGRGQRPWQRVPVSLGRAGAGGGDRSGPIVVNEREAHDVGEPSALVQSQLRKLPGRGWIQRREHARECFSGQTVAFSRE